MANRVLLGQGSSARGSSNYGLWISKPSRNVLLTGDENIVFDSTKSRTGQIYAGGSTSGTSSTITWTSGSKPTLTYIPMYLIFEEGVKVVHEEFFNTNFEEDDDVIQINNQTGNWALTNTSITPKGTNEGGWITHSTAYANGNYNILSDTTFALSYASRTSGAAKFLVLRVPNAYGFMGSSYVNASGTTSTLANHPTLGNTNSLW